MSRKDGAKGGTGAIGDSPHMPVSQQAQETSSAKAGQGLPSIICPVPDMSIRGTDYYGSGAYNASRDGGSRSHNGIDLVATPGTSVVSPVSGTVIFFDPYSDNARKGRLHGVEIMMADGRTVRVIYVSRAGLKNGQKIEAGVSLGAAEDLSIVYKPIKDEHGALHSMTNHVHLDVKDAAGNFLDPTSLALTCRERETPV